MVEHVVDAGGVGRGSVSHAVGIGPDEVDQAVFEEGPGAFADAVVVLLFDAVDIHLDQEALSVQFAGGFQVKVVVALGVGDDGQVAGLLQAAETVEKGSF